MNKRNFILLITIYLILIFNIGVQQTNLDLSRINYERIPDKIFPKTADSPYLYKWHRTWGYSERDYGYGVAVDSSDNIYLAGHRGVDGASSQNVFLLKYNSSGDLLWSRVWDSGRADTCYDIAVDSSDDIYLVGSSLIKFNNQGDEIWNVSLWKDGFYQAQGIQIDSNDNFFITGSIEDPSSSSGYTDIYLKKFNKNGIELWYRIWGNEDDEDSFDLALDSSNNIIVTGKKGSWGEGGIILLKYTSSGTFSWSRVWDNEFESIVYGVALDSSNNIYTVGRALGPTNGGYDVIIAKFNPLGAHVWYQNWGTSADDIGYDVFIDSENRIYLTGYLDYTLSTDKDFFLANFDTQGNYHWNLTWGGTYDDIGRSIIMDSSQNFYIGGEYKPGSFFTNVDACLLKLDHPSPEIKIISPISFQIFGEDTFSFELFIDEPNLDTTWYSINDGLSFTFSGTTGIINKSAWDACGNGNVFIKFYANNTNGYLSFKDVIVYKDIEIPQISINSPLPYQLFGNETILFELNIDEPNLDTTWYSLNDGLNFTFSGTTGSIDKNAWDECDNGTVIIRFYINDTVGNLAYKDIIVRKDILTPQLTIISPLPYQLFGNETILFELNIDEPNLDTTWYSLNDGLNFTFSGTTGSIDKNAWDECDNGTVLINFYALDAAGNLGYNDIVVNKDTSFPDITIISPIPYQLHGKSAINYELLINELNLYNTWYTLNDGIDYEFVGLNGTINQIAWDSCSNGSVNIKFFANNTAGNLAFKEINVFKDILAPNIIVFYPIENDVYGNKAFSFDLSMLDGNLDSKWYSLNDGLNYTFSGDSGTVNQNAWEAFGNGQVIVKFYANDSLGNLGYKEIKVIRDINNPEITINNPSHDEKFYGEAPNYDISIVEPNLESMWYTIDDGVINFTIIQLSGAINQAAWDATPYGNITIRFYAKDLAGNIAYNEIFVEKVEIRGEEPVVYGYNLIIFISLLSVITVISLKKKNNSI